MNNKTTTAALILIAIALWMQLLLRYTQPNDVLAQTPSKQQSGASPSSPARLANKPLDVRVVNQQQIPSLMDVRVVNQPILVGPQDVRIVNQPLGGQEVRIAGQGLTPLNVQLVGVTVKWQYTHAHCGTVELNGFGLQGWEVVGLLDDAERGIEINPKTGFGKFYLAAPSVGGENIDVHCTALLKRPLSF